MIAVWSAWRSASSRQMAPICMSPALQHDASADRAALQQGVSLRGLRERQDAPDARRDRLDGEEMQRGVHVLEGRVAGTGDADAAHDDEAGIELDPLRADIAEHHHGGLL